MLNKLLLTITHQLMSEKNPIPTLQRHVSIPKSLSFTHKFKISLTCTKNFLKGYLYFNALRKKILHIVLNNIK